MTISKNPYTLGQIGRREWNDRYDNLAESRRHWQWAFAAVIILVIIQSIFMGRLAMRSSIQPFVVETNHGLPYAIEPVHDVAIQDPRIVNYALNQFIINVRGVVRDTGAEKNLLNKAYSFSAGKTKNFLRDYFSTHDPFKTAAQNTVTIQIINSLPISKNTWQITWDETKNDVNSDKPIQKTRWMAQLHYEFGPINSRFIMDNPFGIYVTDLTWSENRA